MPIQIEAHSTAKAPKRRTGIAGAAAVFLLVGAPFLSLAGFAHSQPQQEAAPPADAPIEDVYVAAMAVVRESLRAGRLDDALLALEKALQARPGDPAAGELQRKVESLKAMAELLAATEEAREVRRSRIARRIRRHPQSHDAAAVAAALHWLAEHQLPDGGWHFDLHQSPDCRGKCRDPGTAAEARIAATSLALLPFLGAGQTHRLSGKYQATVSSGLDFLIGRMKAGPEGGGSLHEPRGTMYSHGLASIVLCEAYAMTGDKALQKPAQAAIDFIVHAQDPVGGGWRYQPRQAGDTSVFGWQLMALKSGLMADLRVPPETARRAADFLDSVQANEGANYGYTRPGMGEATTAIGLLGRMHLGWKKDHPALQRGVAWLSDRGPSKANMYYNYYATQVMRYWGGEQWTKWNRAMQDHLIETQAKEGHEAGSWHFTGRHSDASFDGRRPRNTAISESVHREVRFHHSRSHQRLTRVSLLIVAATLVQQIRATTSGSASQYASDCLLSVKCAFYAL